MYEGGERGMGATRLLVLAYGFTSAHGHSLYACPEPNLSAPWGLELRWIPEPECSTGTAT